MLQFLGAMSPDSILRLRPRTSLGDFRPPGTSAISHQMKILATITETKPTDLDYEST